MPGTGLSAYAHYLISPPAIPGGGKHSPYLGFADKERGPGRLSHNSVELEGGPSLAPLFLSEWRGAEAGSVTATPHTLGQDHLTAHVAGIHRPCVAGGKQFLGCSKDRARHSGSPLEPRLLTPCLSRAQAPGEGRI